MSEIWDAVVVGSGPNGLVAANRLADAGWSVLVLEAQPTYGGAVRSDSEVRDGFVHDTFSAFYPLGVVSPPLASLDLEQHGLVWEHAPAVLGHVFGDGAWALIHRDRAVTASLLDGGDGDAWLRLCDLWDRIGDDLTGSLLAPFPPVRPGSGSVPGSPARRRPRHGARPAHAGVRPGRGDASAVAPPGPCSRATPGTPTSRCRRRARACSASC